LKIIDFSGQKATLNGCYKNMNDLGSSFNFVTDKIESDHGDHEYDQTPGFLIRSRSPAKPAGRADDQLCLINCQS
jgi:hypothetical protein